MVNNVFHALDHPVRRAIIERVATGSASVGAATGGLGVSKPAISRHLRVLEQAGVVERTIDGRQHHLTLLPGGLDDATKWLDRQRVTWDRMFDAVQAHLEEDGATE